MIALTIREIAAILIAFSSLFTGLTQQCFSLGIWVALTGGLLAWLAIEIAETRKICVDYRSRRKNR